MSEIDDRRRCEAKGCNRLIPKTLAYKMSVKYCGADCRNRMQKIKAAEARRLKRELAETADDASLVDARKGEVFDRIRELLNDDEWDEWLDGKLLNATIAKQLRVSESSVYRSKVTALVERRVAAKSQTWELGEAQIAMLGPSDETMRSYIEDGDTESFEGALTEAISGFHLFRDTYFEYERSKPFITHPFHLNWMREVLRTIYTGGRTMIMSPPRHGKSELLIHFCVWSILRNPNVRILWIGPNDDIAQNMLDGAKAALSEDDRLRADFLPPDTQWYNRGKWGASKFTVANRTIQRKQPTMWCAGARGRILSLDCDFIVVDDPEDPDEAQSPTTREKTKNWFRVKLGTRKMYHTGMVMIGSRVHVDDLFSAYLESTAWNVIVDRAHDTTICGLQLHEDHTGTEGCVLFPELNPLDYLREQEEMVTRPLFEMIYLNKPRPESSMIFNPDLIRDQCLDRSRTLGVATVPGSYRLVAGLDPAARATQAAFVWAVTDDGTAHMVDLETQEAGGVEGAVSVIRRWYEQYGCDVWVIEDVGYQRTFFDHPAVRALKAEGYTIRPTHTGSNKHDPHFGVSAMARQYHEGHIVLPYGDREARRKVDMLIRELELFTDDTTKQRRNKSDILMAHWFPWSQVIKGWQRERTPKQARTSYRPSYPGVSGFDTTNLAPWQTSYPGR